MSSTTKLKVSVVTVCYNAVNTIEETIQSVVNQSYDNIEYIIIDGGSTDGTADVIKKYADRLAYWISEPDKGMYDAIRKGMNRATGDVCCYINSDDFFYKEALSVVAEFFSNHQDVKWIKGRDIRYNEKSQIISDHLPNIIYKRLLNRGMYISKYHQFIQQESIFWRTELNNSVDWNIFSTLRLCGDYYMWMCFSKKARLHIIDTYLGGFRVRAGQLSSNQTLYNEEVRSIATRPCFIDILLNYASKSYYKLFRGGILYNILAGSRLHKWNNKTFSFE